LLLTRDGESTLEIRFCLFYIWPGRLEGDFPGKAVHLGLAPSFF
jgi:hypothetical protein